MTGLPGSPVTNESGEYVGAVPPGWTGAVTPAQTGYSFEPLSRSYTSVLMPIVGEDYAAYTSGSLGITTSSLTNGWLNVGYNLTLLAAGGTLPHSWSITSGRLPAGLTLDPNGNLGGTPTEAGRFPLTIRVTDSAAPDRIQLAAGASSVSSPAVYYDHVTLERIR